MVFRLLESMVCILFEKERRIPTSFLSLDDNMEVAHMPAGLTWPGSGEAHGIGGLCHLFRKPDPNRGCFQCLQGWVGGPLGGRPAPPSEL